MKPRLAVRLAVRYVVCSTETTMLRLKRRQRDVILDKLPDLANLIAGALIFGRFLSGGRFSLTVALAGFVLWAVSIAWTLWLARGGQ
jgi:hypothetical protein